MPDSKIYLMNNILPSDYTHVVDFQNNTAQIAFWVSKAQSDMASAGISSMGDLTYTWTPRGNTIQIGTNINNLFLINYCMIQNTFNNKSKWMYYFITNKTYINDNVTECTLQLDVYQTYLFAFTFGSCYVIREHCNIADDTYDKNFVPEKITVKPQLYYDSALAANNVTYGQYAVMAVTGYIGLPNPLTADSFKISVDYTPGTISELPYELSVLQNVLTPLNYYYFNLNQEKGRAALQYVLLVNQENIQNIVTLFNVQSCCFNVPQTFPGFENWYFGPLNYNTALPNTNYEPRATNITINYTPTTVRGRDDIRNKKLLHAPYNNLVVLNSKLDQKTYDFGRFNGNPSFTVYGTVVFGSKATLVPNNYLDLGNSSNKLAFANSLDVTRAAAIPFIKDDYLAYRQSDEGYAKTKATMQAIASSISSLLGGVGSVMGGMLTGGETGALASGLQSGGNIINTSSNILTSFTDLNHKEDVLQDAGGSVVNNVPGNFDCIAFDLPDIMFATSCITDEEITRLDDYFDTFGYAVEEVKIPETRNRPYWNYLQVKDAALNERTATTLPEFIPYNDSVIIKRIFENGVTIWHDYDDIFNYTLDNHSTTALQERQNNV